MIIYLAENKTTRKIYIGQTSYTLEERRASHLYEAMHSSQLIFHKALRKYGVDGFEWAVIDIALSKEELDRKEQYWIKFYKSCNREFGYNQTAGGTGGRQPPEILEKMSRNRKGIAPWNKGVPRTLAEKEKMRLAHLGQVAWNKGIPRTQEQKDEHSKKMKGRPSSFKGQHHSEQTKEKLRAAWERRRTRCEA